MAKYFLKYTVYNNINFPKGTIVKPIKEEHYNFIVSEGKLKGQKGCIADGLEGWLILYTEKNKKLLKQFKEEEDKMRSAINILNKKWDALPTENNINKQLKP